MRWKILTLAAVALLTLGVGGTVAASTTIGPSAAAPTADAQFTDHTVDDVVDSDDRLGDGAIDRAATIALADEQVQERFDGDDPFVEVWAPSADGDDVTVWISETESQMNAFTVDVDLERETVTNVDEPVELTANESTAIDTDYFDVEIKDDEAATDGADDVDGSGDEPVEVPADELEVSNIDSSNVVISDDGSTGDSAETDETDDEPVEVPADELEVVDINTDTFFELSG